MMALYIPMHPSSKIPMMALCERNARANFRPSTFRGRRELDVLYGTTCDVSCVTTFPVSSTSSDP